MVMYTKQRLGLLEARHRYGLITAQRGRKTLTPERQRHCVLLNRVEAVTYSMGHFCFGSESLAVLPGSFQERAERRHAIRTLVVCFSHIEEQGWSMTQNQWTGREVRILREALRLTQVEFAELNKMSPHTVSKWERLGSSSSCAAISPANWTAYCSG